MFVTTSAHDFHFLISSSEFSEFWRELREHSPQLQEKRERQIAGFEDLQQNIAMACDTIPLIWPAKKHSAEARSPGWGQASAEIPLATRLKKWQCPSLRSGHSFWLSVRENRMTTKAEMKSFLDFMTTDDALLGYIGMPALLLKHGTWFKGRTDSDGYAVTKKWKKKNKPKAKDCFYNAQVFCTEQSGARYFEGYVLIQKGIIPSEHCWVVMQDGRVVDFTLEAAEVIIAEKGYAVDFRGAVYVGVEVPRAFLVELGKTDCYEPIAESFYAEQIEAIAHSWKEPKPPARRRKRPSK
jgi:hypothetical protein